MTASRTATQTTSMAPMYMIQRNQMAKPRSGKTLKATDGRSTVAEMELKHTVSPHRLAGVHGCAFAASCEQQGHRTDRKMARFAGLRSALLSVGKSSRKSLTGFVPEGHTLNAKSEANEYFARDPILQKIGFDEATIIPERKLFGAGGARGVPDFAVYSKGNGGLVFVQVMLSSPASFYGDLREKISKSMTWLGRYDSAIPSMLSRDSSSGQAENEARRLEFTIFLWMKRKPSRRQIRTARRLLKEGNCNPRVSLSCHVQVTRSNKVFPKLYKATEARVNLFSRAAEVNDLRPAFDAPFLQLRLIGSDWISTSSSGSEVDDDSSGSDDDGCDEDWKARYWMHA